MQQHYNTTVLFIDMEGFTSKTSKSSRDELSKFLEEFENLVKPEVKNFGGKIIKGMGDAYLMTFHSPTNAVLCGVEIQKRVKERNERVEKKEQFNARVGISSGEVYERGGDIFGEPVNIASRIESKAGAGDVFFGESVYHAMNKNEVKYATIGKHSLKGINDKIEIYKVHGQGTDIKPVKYLFAKYKWYIIVVLIFLFLIAALNNRDKQVDDLISDRTSDVSGVDEPVIDRTSDVSREVSGIGKGWFNKAEAALDAGDVDTMEELLDIYEDASENEKNIWANLVASAMYAVSDEPGDSLEELEKAALKAKTGVEKRQVKEMASDILKAYSKGSSEYRKLLNFLEKGLDL